MTIKLQNMMLRRILSLIFSHSIVFLLKKSILICHMFQTKVLLENVIPNLKGLVVMKILKTPVYIKINKRTKKKHLNLYSERSSID